MRPVANGNPYDVAVALQRFEPVVRWRSQVGKPLRGHQLIKLAHGDIGRSLPAAFRPAGLGKIAGAAIFMAHNYESDMEYVTRIFKV